MRTEVLKTGIGLLRRMRAGRIAFVAAAFVLGAFVTAPASAQLPLDLEIPTLPPLPLPTLTPLDEEVSGSVDGVVDTVNSIPDQLGAIVPGPSEPVAPAPNPMPGLKPTKVDAWSIERLPALSRTGYASNVPPTTISSSRLARPGSYTSVVGDGFRAAAGRAAHLVGPLAAPLLVALFAILTLALAARGPGQLVKVEEDRQGFRDRRSYRL